MDATPFDFGHAHPLCGYGTAMRIDPPRHEGPDRLAGNWSAIHDAAAAVAAIAGVDSRLIATELERGLAGSAFAAAHGAAIQDLAEIMKLGIAALLVAHTSGGAPTAAARALWTDFLATRERLMAADGDGHGNDDGGAPER